MNRKKAKKVDAGQALWFEQLEPSPGVEHPAAGCLGKLPEHYLQHMPYTNPQPDAPCDRLIASAGGRMHMEDRPTFRVRKECTHPRHFMDIAKNMLHRHDRAAPAFLRSDYQSARAICSPQRNQPRRLNFMLPGKGLYAFMKNVAILQADDEDPSLLGLRVSHDGKLPWTMEGTMGTTVNK
jgi:hypothetical protein